MAAVVVELPEGLRGELKDPFGPVYTDPDDLLAEVDGPLIAVGDVVTYHFDRVGRPPDVALVDERTERSAVDEEIQKALGEPDVTVENPAAALTDDLLSALRDAIRSAEPTRILVDGEEDLATLPAVVAAPEGASVVYGQPGEGMVHVRATPDMKARMRDLIERMDGDPDRALSLIGA